MSTFPDKTQNEAAEEIDAASPTAQILRVIAEGERFLVVSHARPDGDAVGSMLACGELLRQMGKHVELVTADRVPAVYRKLPGAETVHTATRVQGQYDALILLECDGLARARLEGLEEFFLINIDHHVTAHPYGSLNWIDCEAVSVGEMVYRLAKAAGARITPAMATCLYTTVLTDTGGFCYGSLRADTFTLAHDLVEAGADAAADRPRDLFFDSGFEGEADECGTEYAALRRWACVVVDHRGRHGAGRSDR